MDEETEAQRGAVTCFEVKQLVSSRARIHTAVPGSGAQTLGCYSLGPLYLSYLEFLLESCDKMLSEPESFLRNRSRQQNS